MEVTTVVVFSVTVEWRGEDWMGEGRNPARAAMIGFILGPPTTSITIKVHIAISNKNKISNLCKIRF